MMIAIFMIEFLLIVGALLDSVNGIETFDSIDSGSIISDDHSDGKEVVRLPDIERGIVSDADGCASVELSEIVSARIVLGLTVGNVDAHVHDLESRLPLGGLAIVHHLNIDVLHFHLLLDIGGSDGILRASDEEHGEEQSEESGDVLHDVLSLS